MNRLKTLGGPGHYPGKIPLCRPPLPELANIAERLTISLASGILTKGDQLSEFEAEVCQTLGVKYAVGVSSCTVGLTLALASLKWSKGLRHEDRRTVLVPSFTFLATASAALWAGLDPVFVDADEETFNIDVKDAQKKLRSDTLAILCTHIFGNPTGVDEVISLSEKTGVPVIFDAAHGFGILHRGKGIGSEGIASSFSLTPTKLLTSGEGGFVTTNDETMAINLRILREYGTAPGKHDMVYPGLNGRMSELHAILGRWGLTKLESESDERNRRVRLYKDKLSKVPGLSFQKIDPKDRCSYKDFAIRVNGDKFGLTRDELAEVMARENFECKKYFYPAVSNHTYFANNKQDCPVATKLSEEMICPPLFGTMTDAQQEAVIGTIIEAHEKAQEIKKVFK